MQLRRLIAATLVCASVVLGLSFLVGSGSAQPSGVHTCSAADKQFIGTVQSNMTQLGYWSESLISGDVTPAVVIKQARSEAAQVDATRPTDQSLNMVRSLLRQMFLEYGQAVKAKALGNSPSTHIGRAYTLANYVHDALVTAQPGMAAKGCDLTTLLKS